MSISKEQRQELRKAALAGFNIVLLQAPTENVFLSSVDLRCLLDMADERDRYRALLGQAYVDGHHDGYCDAPIMWHGWDEDRAKESWEQSDVKAALEGKNND